MKRNLYISVSTDPIKEYQTIAEYAREMQGHADFLHCDVMDGKFVENKTYDASLVESINQHSLIMLDVHLMTQQPLKSLENYIQAGANIITFHYEAFDEKNDIIEAVKKVKEENVLVGIAIKPETPISDIRVYAHDFDVILVMSVEPGASGQKFLPIAIEKVEQLDKLRKDNDYKYKIEVDGGITPEIAKQLYEAGADMIVSGSYVYKSKDRLKAIDELRN